jgi:hypothetical protein
MAPIIANTNNRAGKVTNLTQTKGSLKPSMRPLQKSGEMKGKMQPLPWKNTTGGGPMQPTVKKSPSGRTPPIYNPNQKPDLQQMAKNRLSRTMK